MLNQPSSLFLEVYLYDLLNSVVYFYEDDNNFFYFYLSISYRYYYLFSSASFLNSSLILIRNSFSY